MPNLGTARAGFPAASLALALLCARPSHRSSDPWGAGRHVASALPARAFRLDVALDTEWSARPLGLASSSPRGGGAAPAGRATRAGLVLCSRLDLRTGGAGGDAPAGLGKRPPLGATLFLPLLVAFELPGQTAASAAVSLQAVAGVVTPSVVAPRRNNGV